MRPSTLSNIDISKTSRPIAIKFYLKHLCGDGKVAYGFGPDLIKSLVSMATDIFNRAIMGESCGHSSAFSLDRIFFILADNEENH